LGGEELSRLLEEKKKLKLGPFLKDQNFFYNLICLGWRILFGLHKLTKIFKNVAKI
jgi:hypothetical protein